MEPIAWKAGYRSEWWGNRLVLQHGDAPRPPNFKNCRGPSQKDHIDTIFDVVASQFGVDRELLAYPTTKSEVRRARAMLCYALSTLRTPAGKRYMTDPQIAHRLRFGSVSAVERAVMAEGKV